MDAFKTAARAEAKDRWWNGAVPKDVNPPEAWILGFQEGAPWARTYLAEQGWNPVRGEGCTMSDDGKLTEKIQAAFLDEKPWRAAVEAVMRYEGYTDEMIAEAYGPVVHTDECTNNGYPFGYDCTDERERDQHPFHTRSQELDNIYRLFFEESPLAAAVLPIIRAAQADAWEEGSGGRDDLRPNPYRSKED